ncbi:hypothetical protein A6R68_13814, partial [Neotoma lepida]
MNSSHAMKTCVLILLVALLCAERDQNYFGNIPNIPFIDANSKISCCKEDLCNAAVPTGGSIWTLAGVLLFSL